MKILSVDGGGYLGLASASFLQGLEQHFRTRCSDEFNLFCGTSTGAIVALGLAIGMSAEEVTQMYESLGPKVFPPAGWLGRIFPRFRGVAAARYDNTPLREALQDAFGNTTLGDLRATGKMVLVTAFSLTSGRPKVFKTDHAADLTSHDRYLLRDIALASSAAPTYLPIVELRDPNTRVVERYCDGGLGANSPALLGYAEAVSHLRVDPRDISLLSLATPRVDLAEPNSALSGAQRALNRGYFGWGFGDRIISLALDGASALTDTALARLSTAAGAQYARVSFKRPDGLGLDVVTPEATETLRYLGSERASTAEIRRQLAPFFSNTEAL